MLTGWLLRIRSLAFSILLHVLAAVLLLISFDFSAKPIQLPPVDNVNIVDAVSVDKKEVEKELKRLKQTEADKKAAEKKRLQELEAREKKAREKAEELKQKRLQEEKKLAEAKKQKELEQKRREEEQKKLVQLEKEKAELEKQRKLEEEKKRKAEEERKKVEEEKKRLEAEAEKQRKAEEARKKAEAERLLQEQLAAEQAELQRQQDATLLQKVAAAITRKVENNFNKTGLEEGLSCKLRVRLLPGGDVVDVSVTQPSGNDIFDRRARTAVQKASPLPVPEDAATFERLNLRDITFNFTP